MNKILVFAILFIAHTAYTQTAIIKGYVTDASNNDPIEFVSVQIPGTEKGTKTNEQGYYELTGLEPGIYSVQASSIGYELKLISELTVTSSRPLELNFKLELSSLDLKEVTVEANAFTKTEESPVSLRTIGVTEIQRNAGSNRDISKVVQSLPGVTTTASFRNDLIIRGGAPNENRFYLDDIEVPNINHFATQGSSGGPVGMINVTFVREVDFYSGAFPANRGNALSSVFNFKQRDGRSDKLGASITAGSSDFGLTLEGPIGNKTTFLASARRSYLEFLFKALELPFLPTYNDFQLKIKHKIDNKNEIYFTGLGAIDQFALNKAANKTENQQYILGQIPENTQWNYTNGLVYKHYTNSGSLTFVLSRNMLNNEAYKYQDNDETKAENLILNYKSQEIENKIRIEHTTRFGKNKLNYGIGYEYVKYNNDTYNKIFAENQAQIIQYQTDLNIQKYYAFGQYSRKFLDNRLSLSLGIRLEGNDYSDEMSNPFTQAAPRISISYALSQRLSINANSGIYYQLPPYTLLGYKEQGVYINKENNIKFIQSNHVVAGLEYNTSSSSRITLEGYYKYYSNYPMLIRDSLTLANLGGDFGVIGNAPAIPFAHGRAYGIELLLQQRLYKGFYGILAYTLGWSEFEDKNHRYVASSWDSRHIINLTLGKKFNRNWELGVNWRLQTGLPFTPYASNSALVNSWNLSGQGIIDYDQLNTERSGIFNQIDIRVDKKWFFPKWSLNLYLDIENITGSKISREVLILDRPLDADGNPIGNAIIENPQDPKEQQRYKLKSINDATGTVLPSIGLLIEF